MSTKEKERVTAIGYVERDGEVPKKGDELISYVVRHGEERMKGFGYRLIASEEKIKGIRYERQG